MINGDGTTHGTYHWQTDGNCGDKPFTHPSVGSEHPDPSFSDGFHEYAVEFGSDSITFAIDGSPFQTLQANETESDGGTKGMAAELFDVPYYIILNTAIGGPWPGPVDDTTTFPQYHKIDYVRVAQPA